MNNNYHWLSLLISIIFFHNISVASIWINENRIIESDSTYSYEIYIGCVSRLNLPQTVTALPNAGTGAIIESIDSSQYSSLIHIQSGNDIQIGEQFDLYPASSTLYVMYDSNFQIIGTFSQAIDPYVIANAIDTYTVCPRQEVELYGYQFNNPGYTLWVDGVDYSERCYDGWSINGISVPNTLTYDYLTTELGLTEGTYELRLDVTWDYGEVGDDYFIFDDYATTTITIVPEPITILTFGLGAAIALVRKKDRKNT